MKGQVAKRLMDIARSEGLAIESNAAELLVESVGNDIRQCLNALQMWARTETSAKCELPSGHARLARARSLQCEVAAHAHCDAQVW